MQGSTVLIILFVLGATILVVYLLRKSRGTGTSSGGGHIIPPSGKTTVKCPISIHPTKLKSCDPSNPDSCDDCSDGMHACFTVSDDIPYQVQIDGKTVNIPNGNWCLPAKVKTLPCNEFSGFPILAKLNETEYVWKCQCKYPSLFTNQGEFGDCTQEVACGAENNDSNHLVCPPKSTHCKPGTKWVDDPTWEPTSGICSCATGLKYIDKSIPSQGVWNKQCVTDSCSPGKTVNGKCVCPPKQDFTREHGVISYLRCPDDMPDSFKSNCIDNPECIQDPCNPGGYYDSNKGKCVCAENRGFIAVEDSTSPVKWICEQGCSGKLNPCGNRGDCVIKNGKIQCENCHPPWVQNVNYSDCAKKHPNMCMCQQLPLNSKCKVDSDCLSGNCQSPVFKGDKFCGDPNS